MDNLEKAINEAEQKVLDIVEVAVSSEKYSVVKRHIQNAFGRLGLRGKLGLERKGNHNERTKQETIGGVSQSNPIHEGKRRYPNRSD